MTYDAQTRARLICCAAEDPTHVIHFADGTREALAHIEYRIIFTADDGCLAEDYKHVFKNPTWLTTTRHFTDGVITTDTGKLWTTRRLSDLFPDAKIKFGRAVGLQFCC